MAPKQNLNIGDTDALLKSLGLPQKPKTFGQLANLYGQGILNQGPLKDRFVPPTGKFKTVPGQSRGLGILKDIANVGLSGVDLLNQGISGISALTNPSGNIVGDYLSQLDPEAFRLQTEGIGAGPEIFLPDDKTSSIPGSDIFTETGQSKLASETSKALKDLIGKSVGDVGAFDPQGDVDQATIDKLQEEAKSKPSEVSTSEVIDTSFDSDFDADTTDSSKGTGDEVEGADTPAKKATVKALDEFLKEARPGINPRKYADYIKEFGEVTGLDVSGEPDTKQALMSFGLALMQNRAGKGFNISNILKATGEAGESAMPDFRKAVSEAKAIRAKAGAYALSKKESDQKEAMNRKSYFVIPKGDGTAGTITNMIAGGKGRLERLNSYELNDLINNPEFEKQFEVVDADFYKDYAKAALTAAGKKKFYQSKSVDVPLFAEAPKGLSFKAQLPDGNVAPAGTSPLFIDSSKRVVGMIQNMERKVDYNAKEFEKLANLLNQTDVDVIDQSRSIIKQTLRNFGLNIGDTDPVKQIKTIMQRLQATNAAEILQESGKTLSDADRKFVREIVGDVNFLEGDEAVLRGKLSNLFNVIVKRGRENIRDAYSTLSAHGVNIDNRNILASGSTMVKGEDNVFRFKVQGTT